MKQEEKVLTIASNLIFQNNVWQGVKSDNLDYYLDLIRNNYQFKKRSEIENDPNWQQIIPYILFSFEDKFFLYKYLKRAGEKRLVDNYQLGVGGHINPADLEGENTDFLAGAGEREWLEEIDYKGRILDKKLVGILNDQKRPVEKVHLGLIYHFIGDSPQISVRETGKMKGELVDLKNLGQYVKNIQGWPPIIYREYLSKFLK